MMDWTTHPGMNNLDPLKRNVRSYVPLQSRYRVKAVTRWLLL